MIFHQQIVLRRLSGTSHSPLLGTSAIRAAHIEVVRLMEKRFPVRVLLALHWEPVIDVILGLHQLEKGIPGLCSFLAVHERFHVAKHDEAISRSGEKDVEPLTCCEETNVAISIAPGQGDNDYVSLFTLIVVF